MEGVAQARQVLRGTWHLLVANRWAVLLFAALAAGAGLLLFPHDAVLLAQIHFWPPAQEAEARRLADFFGTWGDYLTYNLPLALALWLFGAWKKNSACRRLAIICFLGATFAGVADDCLRLTLGRPRPDAHLPDGFYGLPDAWSARFESFPSGHAAAVFGTAFSLLVSDLSLGIVTTVYALLVIWARMELYRHYSSDIVVGSMIGISVGLLVGLGAKVRLPRRSLRLSPPAPA
jgi:membrane-associated phospholipid phosphatase